MTAQNGDIAKGQLNEELEKDANNYDMRKNNYLNL